MSYISDTKPELITKAMNRAQEIQDEKRKRIQAYNALQYFLSSYSHFDFFSLDSFQSAKYSKYWAQNYGQKIVEKEHILLTLTEESTTLASMLCEEKITKAKVKDLISNVPPTSKIAIQVYIEHLLFLIQRSLSEKKIRLNRKIKFSDDVHSIFEIAAENALTRFRTPVITSAILLITLFEENEFFRVFITKKTDWLLLRYSLFKRLHHEEISSRRKVIKNQRYFVYLLKTRITEKFFNRLINRNLLGLGVQLFRNALILETLKHDFAKCAEQEIIRSNRIISMRKYSY